MERYASFPRSGDAPEVPEVRPPITAAPACPPVYVLLVPVRDKDDPTRFCPRAVVLVDDSGRWRAYPVQPEDQRSQGSAAAANAVMVPAAQKWLRSRGWRTYEFFVPQR